MTSTNKGIVAIIFGILSILNQNIVVLIVGISAPSFLISHSYSVLLIIFSIFFFCSIMAIYFGVQARKGNAKIVGLIGIVLGIIGAVFVCTQIGTAVLLLGIQ
ncbi:MAG: hypothetical protein Q7K54_02570 [Candidatus Parcubacteria bacterium]|nr:hypothetical protein [Candidatus Parcubacteria bacterium]